MSEIVRKKTTGEPGNPGEFGTGPKAASGLDLSSSTRPIQSLLPGDIGAFRVEDYLGIEAAVAHQRFAYCYADDGSVNGAATSQAESALWMLDLAGAEVEFEMLDRARQLHGEIVWEVVDEYREDRSLAGVQDLSQVPGAWRGKLMEKAILRHRQEIAALKQEAVLKVSSHYLELRRDREQGVPVSYYDHFAHTGSFTDGWGYDPGTNGAMRTPYGKRVVKVVSVVQGILEITDANGEKAWLLNDERNDAIADPLRSRDGWYRHEVGRSKVALTFPREMSPNYDLGGMSDAQVRREWLRARAEVRATVR